MMSMGVQGGYRGKPYKFTIRRLCPDRRTGARDLRSVLDFARLGSETEKMENYF
jgi:hypothetical protein